MIYNVRPMRMTPPLALLLALATTGCSTTSGNGWNAVPEAWRTVEQTRRIAHVAYGEDGKPAPASGPQLMKQGAVAVKGGHIVNGDRVLTPEYAAIDSFDVSWERGEVAFSAKRTDNFDVALVSTDGSDVHWVPEDRADETHVTWAPRGNKISYFIHNPSAALIRTVHVPTAYQLTVDIPYATLHDLAWEPAAEKYAVAVESLDASDHIEVHRYDATQQSVALAPEKKLDVEIEPLTADAAILRPAAMRYNERLPVVVWLVDPPRNRWNDARGALQLRNRVACIVSTASPDAAFWAALGGVAWPDRDRVFVVDTRHASATYDVPASALRIVGSPAQSAAQWRRSGNIIEVGGGVVESFAAGFIADQLKGSTPPNGSHR